MNQKNYPSPVFHEVQQFRQTWVMFVVLAVAGLQWYAVVEQLLLGRPFGQNPMPDSMAFIFWILIGFGLPLFFFYCRLVTEVREDGIYFRYIPFHWSYRRIAFEDVVRCEVKTYNAIREYGGWGIRWRCKGKAYSVSGNQGIRFELMNGKRLLIGSQRAEDFWQAIPVKYRAQTDKNDL
ncbi:MAG: DUF6141 family protein [Pelolinea sp.]|nr:DUF6141 family protein [Pelolinea sp.]